MLTATRNIVITAANDLYLPLLLGMLRSLRSLSFSTPFDIGVLDIGLGDPAKAELAAFNVSIVAAQADMDFPGREAWERQFPSVRSLTARPFLRRYFPGYSAYLWIDADAWAQTPAAIDTMLAGANSDDSLYIASEIDRDYRPYFISSQPWEYHLKWYRANFPPETVAAIFPRPMLNAGIWAINAASPVWDAWAETYTNCLRGFTSLGKEQLITDQLSLNIAVYTKGLALKIMPAEFNWLSLYCVPMFDETAKLFVRPTAPRTVISMLHLTHEKKLRVFDLATPTGGIVTRSLQNEIT